MKDFFFSGRNVFVVAGLIAFSLALLAVLTIKESKPEYVTGLIQLISTLIGILGGILIPRDSTRRSDTENTNIERTTTVSETAVTSIQPEAEKGK